MKLIIISLILIIFSKLDAQIIDSSNISYLSKIADGPNRALDIKGNRLYAAGGSNFYIFDISDPSSLAFLCKITMPGFIDKIIVKDNLAFVLCGNHGIRIIDISNSTSPAEINHLSLSLSIINFKIVDSILYAADIYDGLIVYDISDFDNPVILSNYDTPGYGQDIDINGNYIYFADNYEGMHIFDISNPSQPKKLSTINPGQYIDRLSYRDNLVFAVDQDFGLRVIDVTNPSIPYELSNLSIQNTPRQITLNGNFIYMGGHKLHIIDISDVHHPSILNSYGDYLFTAEVKYKENYVYILAESDGLRTLDISEISNPLIINYFEMPSYIREVDFENDFAFIAYEFSGLRVYNASNPENLDYISSFHILHPDLLFPYLSNLRTNNGFVYLLTDYNGLQVINITDPYNLSFADSISFTSLTYCRDIAFYQNYAYLTNYDEGITILDINNPNDLRIVGKFREGIWANRIKINNHYAFVSDLSDYNNPKIQILDISNPTNPKITSSYFFNDDPSDFFIKENYLYVAASTQGLRVLDISNIQNPVEVNYYNPGNNYTLGVAVDDRYAYIADGLNGLIVSDISDINHPSVVGYIDYGGNSFRVVLHNSKIYVTDFYYGLLVLNNDLITSLISDNPMEFDFELFQNYPNPFNASTVISFSITKEENVSVKLYDVLGNYVDTIFEGIKQSGKHNIIYNSKSLSAGVYFYKITTSLGEITRKMIYLK